MAKLSRIEGDTLKPFVSHWPPQRWQEYESLLIYCRENGIRLIAGTPLKVLRTIQAEGIRGLSKDDRKIYAPPAGSGFISGFSSISRRSSVDINFPNQSAHFGPSSYLSVQARVVEDYNMSQYQLAIITPAKLIFVRSKMITSLTLIILLCSIIEIKVW